MIGHIKNSGSVDQKLFSFYPTTLKDCCGIVFTHGVQIGGQAVGKNWAVSQKG